MDWTALRAEFPVTRTWAYFDHAAVAPLSGRARQALHDWADDIAANGLVHVRGWGQRVEEVRGLAAQLVNADPLDIAFIKNTSEGIGLVAEGLPWQPGDNVVTAAEEYPANIYPWMNLAGRGVELRRVESRGPRVEIDDIRAAIDGRTRLLSLSFVEYASGFRNDLDALGQLCREKNVLFFVDAIQGLGVLPLDVRRTPVDFLAADGHKWLLGPEGAGVFYCRRERVDRLHPVGVGWNSVVGALNFAHIDFTLKPHAGRWESGTLNVGGISALGTSLGLLLEIGIPTVAARVRELTDYLCEQSQRAGFEVYSSRRPEDQSGIVSLIVPGADVRQLVRRCRDQGIVINQRAGRVRVSPHCYNSPEEIDRLIQSLAETQKHVDSSSNRVAVYTGVFDPVHLGHLDVIRRGSRIFDRLVVGVGINPEKASFFSIEERVALVRKVVTALPNVEVQPFTGLAVHFVRSVGARIMLRGLRTLSDMEYEFSMSLTNLSLAPELESVFLMAEAEYSHVNSTLIRQIATFQGDLDKFVPPEIKAALLARVGERLVSHR